MVKFRLYFDKDKETEYLNEMAREGYAMTGFCMGFYRFDECRPGEYIYQIDITEGLFRVSSDYREFMKDMGVEIVCLWGPWVILRKRAEEGPFVLYTDVESSIGHYTKIRHMFKIVMLVEICAFFVDLMSAVRGVAAAWGGCFLLLAIIILFARELNRINAILAELKARSGVDAGEMAVTGRSGRPSGVLALAFFVNGIGFLVPDVSESAGFLKGICQGMALMFFVLGLILTFCRRG